MSNLEVVPTLYPLALPRFKPALAGHGDADGLADLAPKNCEIPDVSRSSTPFGDPTSMCRRTTSNGSCSRAAPRCSLACPRGWRRTHELWKHLKCLEDLKALYLTNVLKGDTSRASKFRVHVEARTGGASRCRLTSKSCVEP